MPALLGTVLPRSGGEKVYVIPPSQIALPSVKPALLLFIHS